MFKGLVPWLRPYAGALVSGEPVRITSVRRSLRQQVQLYRAYRRGQSRFPAAPPGRSKHQLGLAWDMIADDRTLRRLGKTWQSWGGRWGGKHDPIHFEA